MLLNKKKYIEGLKKISFIIPAVFHYFISLKLSLNFIDFSYINQISKERLPLFKSVEFIYFVILIFLYKKLFDFIKNKERIIRNKEYIKTFFVYFSILFILLLTVWPGIWRWDDLHLVLGAKGYYLNGWHNFFSSLFYIISLKFIPSFVGVVIMQCIVISLIVSYVINKVCEFLNLNNIIYKVILYIPFLLLPVLDSNLYPLRPTIYSYLILLYFIKMIDCYKCQRLTYKELIKVIIILILLTFLRNEGIYFAAISLFISIIFFKKMKINIIQFIILPLSVILISLLLYVNNEKYLYSNEKEKYNISSTMGSVVTLVIKANEEFQEDLLNTMDKVINVDYIMQNPTMHGSTGFWLDLLKTYYTEDDYNSYMKAYYKLCIMYPDIFLKQQWEDFTGASGYLNLLKMSTKIYDMDVPDEDREVYYKFESEGGNFSKPINIALRKKIISFLEGRNPNDYYETNLVFDIFWNLFPPLIVNFVFCIYLLIKKKFYYLFLIFTINIKLFLVFITAPSGLFMYYFSDYLIGYFLLALLIILIIKKILKLKDEYFSKLNVKSRQI